jgi:3-oxoacyl-[acyl-carrier protein] reductase
VYNFQERTILYTGAAGGLGLPTTISYLEAGAKVVVLDNDLAKIDALRSAAKDCDGLHIFEVDLSISADVKQALVGAIAATGGIDTLINNAAIYPSKPFVEFSIEEFQLVERINVESAVLCAQGTFPYMKERHFGRIVNISSITFNGAWTNLSAYMASKGALIGLTRAWAREFGEFGVSVNSISPGAFPTDAEKIQGDPAAYNQFCLDSQAIKRRGAPADITNALMFFTSRESGFITGQNLNVDGGWVMS